MLTHLSYSFHRQRYQDHTDCSILAYICKNLIYYLSYSTEIRAHVQLLLPLFCKTSQRQTLPTVCIQSLSKFQATGNKEFQHHRDQNSSMPREIRGYFRAAYRHFSLEQAVNMGARISISSRRESKNAIFA